MCHEWSPRHPHHPHPASLDYHHYHRSNHVLQTPIQVGRQREVQWWNNPKHPSEPLSTPFPPESLSIVLNCLLNSARTSAVHATAIPKGTNTHTHTHTTLFLSLSSVCVRVSVCFSGIFYAPRALRAWQKHLRFFRDSFLWQWSEWLRRWTVLREALRRLTELSWFERLAQGGISLQSSIVWLIYLSFVIPAPKGWTKKAFSSASVSGLFYIQALTNAVDWLNWFCGASESLFQGAWKTNRESASAPVELVSTSQIWIVWRRRSIPFLQIGSTYLCWRIPSIPVLTFTWKLALNPR